MFVVDLLHEFELGVWKMTFAHIIRVLYAAVAGGEAVAKFNARLFLVLFSFTTIPHAVIIGFARFPLLVVTQSVDFLTMLLR